MQSMQNPKQSDDPHDVVVVASDAVRVAPSDEELSNLLQQAARYRSDTQTRAASDFPAGPTVPPVDATFRPAAVNDALAPSKRWSMVRRAARGFIGLLLAACIGLAAFAWRTWGDAVEKKIAKWTTQVVMTASLQPENSAPAAPPPAPAVAADAANAQPPQPAAPAQSAAQAVASQAVVPTAAAPSAESTPLLQSMARDLASMGQEMEQLKASIEQLKASQQQISRDVAKVSEAKVSEAKVPEQNPRPRMSALPPRPAVARARRPMPPYPAPQAAPTAAPYPAAAPYYAPRQSDYAPRQSEPQPQVAAEPQADPELASVPRPPMPVR
jgi:hypothetical protein